MIAVIANPQLPIGGDRQTAGPHQVTGTRAASPYGELVSPIVPKHSDIVRGVVRDKDSTIGEEEKTGNIAEDVRIPGLVDTSDRQVDGTAKTRGSGLSCLLGLKREERDRQHDRQHSSRRARNGSKAAHGHGSAEEWVIQFRPARSLIVR
jgi:hypothetical protein